MFGVFLAILFIAIRFYTKLENSKEIKILEFVYFPIYRTTDVLQLNRKAVLGSEDLPNIPLKNPQSKALSYFVYFLIFAISFSLLFGDFTLVKIY